MVVLDHRHTSGKHDVLGNAEVGLAGIGGDLGRIGPADPRPGLGQVPVSGHGGVQAGGFDTWPVQYAASVARLKPSADPPAAAPDYARSVGGLLWLFPVRPHCKDFPMSAPDRKSIRLNSSH